MSSSREKMRANECDRVARSLTGRARSGCMTSDAPEIWLQATGCAYGTRVSKPKVKRRRKVSLRCGLCLIFWQM